MIKAVIFDLDNTLYDYDIVHKQAMADLQKYTCEKLEITSDKFYETFFVAREDTKQELGSYAAGHNRMIYCQKMLEKLGVNPVSCALEMYDVYWNGILSRMRLREGVGELLSKLRGLEIKIAICTDLTAHIQHRKLRALNIISFIDVLVTSEEAGKEKPDPKNFNLCLDKLGLNEKEVVYIGDDYQKDIVGASNVGVRAILLDIHEEIGGIFDKIIGCSDYNQFW